MEKHLKKTHSAHLHSLSEHGPFLHALVGEAHRLLHVLDHTYGHGRKHKLLRIVLHDKLPRIVCQGLQFLVKRLHSLLQREKTVWQKLRADKRVKYFEEGWSVFVTKGLCREIAAQSKCFQRFRFDQKKPLFHSKGGECELVDKACRLMWGAHDEFGHFCKNREKGVCPEKQWKCQTGELRSGERLHCDLPGQNQRWKKIKSCYDADHAKKTTDRLLPWSVLPSCAEHQAKKIDLHSEGTGEIAKHRSPDNRDLKRQGTSKSITHASAHHFVHQGPHNSEHGHSHELSHHSHSHQNSQHNPEHSLHRESTPHPSKSHGTSQLHGEARAPNVDKRKRSKGFFSRFF